MQFRISDTFTDSLANLTGDEQKAVKTTAFDLQLNPAGPGMRLHRIEGARDPNFWSVRVSRDLRLIVHRTGPSLLLCYVGHHDDAYRWAARRKLETHPKTGVAQLVEIRELVRKVIVPKVVEAEPQPTAKSLLYADIPENDLLGYGVPAEWVCEVREATEDTILDLVEHLPGEAAEALLELATGGRPQPAPPARADEDPFQHPDAQRRFRLIANVEELERALKYPWEKWMVFLHPAQRALVERDFNGPARISGSAGTGKTIVALHRAVFLAKKHPDARVLLATFSEPLAAALHHRLRRLISSEPHLAERLEVHALSAIGRRLGQAKLGRFKITGAEPIRKLLATAAAEVSESRFTPAFLWAEWHNVVDAWQLETWEDYRDVRRLGRKTRLAQTQREILWRIFERVRGELARRKVLTQADVFSRVAEKLRKDRHAPFDFAVIDEAQDVSVPELRFLAALGGGRPNSLFFAGDLGQRIFQQPFSWKALGVDVRGRSFTLRVNYRTSHQIRRQADRLLPPELTDVDGNTEDRRGTVSVFNGPAPRIQVFDTEQDETRAVAEWLRELLKESFRPREIGIFVRSTAQLDRARRAVALAGLKCVELSEGMQSRSGHVSIGGMHLAKGLEFRAVAVMACDDEVIPSQDRIESISDSADLEEIYNTERHLLYVACTRARDRLMVSGVDPASEFLEDLATDRAAL
ncbi:MAG: UvrD-helicase domain-containing protein [Kiritimatiellaeota bacterium]|nr:UvrD-helicase domain-containing protein [Kiritimatiellota bacterium]